MRWLIAFLAWAGCAALLAPICVAAYHYKYGSSPTESGHRGAAGRRCAPAALRRQHEAGQAFLVGDSLSAVDIYWAVSANLFAPLPQDELPLPDVVRATVLREAEPLRGALDPLLLEHQHGIYRRFLRLPVEL